MPATPSPQPAAASGTIAIGGDLPVHRLGFGAMRVTGKGVWGEPPNHAEAIAVLRRTLELGINFIDTADSYGPEVSERLIAEALHPYPAGLVIATKGGYLRPGPNQWKIHGPPDHLRAVCEGSLRRLKLERIDLYQLHRIDPEVGVEAQLGELVRLQQEGKIRHIGLSEVSVEEIVQARRLAPIVSVQNRYNVADRQWEPVVDYCTREGIAFIPWAPLISGSIGGLRNPLRQIAKETGASRAQAAIAWLLARSPVMVPIPGTGSVKHLEENTAAAGLPPIHA
jgi:aryl-alcohol dehydrogenase-like predicted oxidoreductase